MNHIQKMSLEDMIDQHGTKGVADMLAEICSEKAEHLRSNWQDEAAARAWEREAKQFDRFVPRTVQSR